MKEIRGNHFNFKYDQKDEATSQTIIKNLRKFMQRKSHLKLISMMALRRMRLIHF